MIKQNLLSDMLRGPGSFTPDTPGKPRFFLHLAAAFLVAVPLLSLSITIQADTPGPLETEAFYFQGGDQESLTIGVLDLDANGVEDTEARAISERLRIWLGRTGVFEVIERNQMESIMNEIGFQVSGACDTDECVVQIGQVLGASKMVAGSVSKVGTLYSLQVRIIDIASSRIDHQEFLDVPGGIEEVLTGAAEAVANALAARVSGQTIQQQPTPQPAITPGQPARLTTAMVMIESNPPGGTIMIDGIDMGPTPANLQVNEGTHEVSVELAGYRAGTKTINVVGGQAQTVTLPLIAIPLGYLDLVTDPPQCTVLIDGRDIGQLTPLRRFEVYEGQHTVEVRRDGFSAVTDQVTIAPRRTSSLEMILHASGTSQITFRNQLTGAVATLVGRESYQAALNRAEESLSMMPGDYTLTVKAKGYSKYTSQINLADGDNQVVPITLRPKSRIVAGILSVIPGMGQFYSGKSFMGFLMLAGVGGTLGATLGEKSNYDDILTEYEALQDQYSQATTTTQIQSLRSAIEDQHGVLTASRDKMNSTAMIMTVVWAVNILDAVALMPKLRPIAAPGVQSDLSLGTREGRLSLTLSLSFR
ncbi:PEGA domain-containing protein [Gemmatimonadota bacterium]